MKIDASLRDGLKSVAAEAQARETEGYDGVITFETAHDPFLPLLLAAGSTERVELMTSIAVAFARTPMTVAGLAHDLNKYSDGRMILGLGSQIKPHITKRYSMPWSAPAARMKEFIQALHAIWDCWYEAKELNFRGDYYTHTLMTPMFTPQDVAQDNTLDGWQIRPKIYLAAVGPKMTETAAAVADGLLIHPFTTERYLRETTLATIEATLTAQGRAREEFDLVYPIMVATAEREEDYQTMRQDFKKRLGFYASTPAYRPVLDLHGWGEIQPELNLMTKQGRWAETAELISDEILETFVICGEADTVVAEINKRFGGLLDRAGIDFPHLPAEQAGELLAALRN